MYPDGRTRLRLGTTTNRLSRWLAVLFPFSIIGSVFGQNYLVPPPGFQGAPAVPSMGNVTTTTGPADTQINSQTVNQLNAQANAEANGQPNIQANGPGNGPVNGQPNAQSNGKATSQFQGGKTSGAATPPLIAPVESLMQWGALHLHTRASYQFMYSTGVHSEPGKNEDTYTQTLTPGVTIQLGPHVTFDYSPSLRFFSQSDFHNTVDHSASLVTSLGYGDWNFGLVQNFSMTDEPLVQTSSQTQQKTYSAGVSATYHLNDKVSLETGGGISLIFLGGSSTNVFVGHGTNGVSSPLSDSRSYSGSENISYHINEKISTGIGVTVGYSEQDSGFRMVSETLHGDLSWHPAAKLSASLSAGAEHQEFLDSNASDSWSPIYGVSIGYHLFEPTTLTIYANRSAGTSLFQNQTIEYTALGAGIQQRLLGKLQLSLGFGYTKSDYQDTTTTNLATSRGDEGTSYSAGLSMSFLKHCNLGTYYSYSQNTSSTSGFGYSSSQAGLTFSWAY